MLVIVLASAPNIAAILELTVIVLNLAYIGPSVPLSSMLLNSCPGDPRFAISVQLITSPSAVKSAPSG